ncbi:MAG: MBL fold metallo-hydrolase [Candidatus Izemoplasmataceae bacterium]
MVKAIINDFAENCYIIHENNEAYIIDPGSNYQEMKRILTEENLTLKAVLLTHGHYDHIGGLNHLLEDFDAPIYIHTLERDFLFDPNLNLSTYMSDRFKISSKHKVHTFDEVESFKLGEDHITVHHTPGHTRGSVSFHYKNLLFSGDCLFRETIGRTDLPTGDPDTIIETVNNLVKVFEPNTLVYPGHGHFTTIAHEMNFNPYIKSA